MLNTAFGKACVSGLKGAKNLAVKGLHGIVSAAEWVIDKGTEAVNYVGKKVMDGAKWIGNSSLVQGAINMAKSVGTWIASTSIYKDAVNLAMNLFTRMSNYCTAVYESYQYYNQCRSMARKIANEHQIDEHVILKTFNLVTTQEDVKMKKEIIKDQVKQKLQF